jgi:catechol 2,3-dioxygenase-like lactoylglutathione lyase family enzyme
MGRKNSCHRLVTDEITFAVVVLPVRVSGTTAGASVNLIIKTGMTVKRIVANIAVADTARARQFYGEVLGLSELMNHGWITTYGSGAEMQVQVSVAVEGGSGTPVPDLSVEVDNLEEVLQRVQQAAIPVEYGPAEEPWGVRRFYVRDPFGKLINILTHAK